MAVGDITVDKDFEVKDGGDSLWREINATIINAGESSWPNLPVKFTVENLQGEDNQISWMLLNQLYSNWQVTQFTEI